GSVLLSCSVKERPPGPTVSGPRKTGSGFWLPKGGGLKTTAGGCTGGGFLNLATPPLNWTRRLRVVTLISTPIRRIAKTLPPTIKPTLSPVPIPSPAAGRR